MDYEANVTAWLPASFLSRNISVNRGINLYPFAYFYGTRSQENGTGQLQINLQINFAERGNIQCGWKRRRWRRILSWIKTSKIHDRRILATKTITNCWCSKNRFCMKSKRQQSAIKYFGGAFFIHKFDRKLRAKRTLTYISSSYVTKKNLYFHVWTGLWKNWWLQIFHFFCKRQTRIFFLVRTGPKIISFVAFAHHSRTQSNKVLKWTICVTPSFRPAVRTKQGKS